MLRLSKLADYAVVVLIKLGQMEGLTTASILSAETGMPEPTVAKLLKGLAGQGIINSSRGARGGYSLASSLTEISIAQVIAAVDGPVMITACCDNNYCSHEVRCGLSAQWDRVNFILRHVLESISLADMCDPNFTMPAAMEPSQVLKETELEISE
ncbi:SUF system Fe-S cluster assembly regulator [Aristophania vespae]|uniref:SUF system Fe-S cluster assembly regulator n=1 Tax=Aristophania vespae TaxID=2697033 RepID=A0A6P1NE45_9PROT|nr:SUF system Fe-S cluster assembly regulator [Aristophania vespae]QHI95703.1 SUF system Fe-S cluster assembly regulator [Aristophania vespae]UMM63396.1 Putative HTH-type transcriptional regulator [Aristophania vespae]